ncbi:alpha-amylase family protein [Nocardioides sp. ChNu-153]|uniref:alpha-amylase family protein n=1 Tax=unclassified Nocardioides TaxID=2615069 RepID=UPI0024062622|nr:MULTISPECIES: alpha-amylase family protein [unclassified Nocardioides]MDF9714654.1 alpha-amylase family protein [Nocardioides sp. ChNu-99]MDN7119811.1 alpha-amylase family protein [Nocardioides sp. ChNu-153]
MDWQRHVIWWHVYPLGFSGAPIREPDPSPGPRLRTLLPWLDHVIELGASGLLLGPVFASETHGYDTVDHFRVDPRLGDDADLDLLLAECRRRGIRVLLDGVFSHVGREHPLVAQALADPDGDAARVVDLDRGAPGGPRPRVFEGHDALVRLDHSDPATADLVVDVMGHWLRRGVDGWRLDAAYSVDPAFWAAVLPRVRAEHPEAWFLGEVIHGDYPAFVAASGVDSVTQYELWKAIWSSILDRNLHELDHALGRHAEFLRSFVPQTFVGNHDVTRIATTLGAEGAVVALAVLMTVGGIPSVYAGDEHGFTGTKEERLGGDDAVRPAFPASPADLSPLGEPVFRAHQALVALRRRHPWLVDATTRSLRLDNTRYAYRATSRTSADDHLDVEIDLEGAPAALVRAPDGSVLWRSAR